MVGTLGGPGFGAPDAGAKDPRPEAGCSGFPARVRELLTLPPRHGHHLASTQVAKQSKPLFFCTLCG
eukprot:406516-Pyramimonas_sp.AAC.1